MCVFFDVTDVGGHLFELLLGFLDVVFHFAYLLVEIGQIVVGISIAPDSFGNLYQRIAHQNHQKKHSPHRSQALKKYNQSHILAYSQEKDDQQGDNCNSKEHKIKHPIYFQTPPQPVSAVKISGIFPLLQHRNDGPRQDVD